MTNQALFLQINNLASQNAWLDKLAIFFAAYVGFILLAFLIYSWFSRPASRKMVVLALIAGGIARLVVTNIIRFFYPHPRPFDAMSINQLIPESGSSFPSGHASFFFALSTIVFLYNRRLGWIFFVASALMGIARVYVGVHWPLDILGGILVGIVIAVLVNLIYNKLYKIKRPN